MRNDVAIVLMIVAVFGSLTYAGVSAIVHAGSRAACLAAGYPEVRMTWDLDAYCVRRVDQTDIVEPLSKVRKERS